MNEELNDKLSITQNYGALLAKATNKWKHLDKHLDTTANQKAVIAAQNVIVGHGEISPHPFEKSIAKGTGLPQKVYYMRMLFTEDVSFRTTKAIKGISNTDNTRTHYIVTQTLIYLLSEYIHSKQDNHRVIADEYYPSIRTSTPVSIQEKCCKEFETLLYNTIRIGEDATSLPDEIDVFGMEEEEILSDDKEYRKQPITPSIASDEREKYIKAANEARRNITLNWPYIKRAKFIEYLQSFQPTHSDDITARTPMSEEESQEDTQDSSNDQKLSGKKIATFLQLVEKWTFNSFIESATTNGYSKYDNKPFKLY